MLVQFVISRGIEKIMKYMYNTLIQKLQDQPSSKVNVKEWMLFEWEYISVKFCGNFVNSMSTRLQSVIENKGGHTKYWF